MRQSALKLFRIDLKTYSGIFITSCILTGHFQPLKISNIVFQAIASIEHPLK